MILGSVKVKEAKRDQPPRISATASSDERDLGNDVMSRHALEQMRDAFGGGMTLFLNHSYRVPDDVAGKIVAARIVKRGQFNDLDIEAEVAVDNPRAMQAFDQILSGIRLGVSIGILVQDAEFVDTAEGRVMRIESCLPLEASLCGLPSNRRSWTHGALKAASARYFGFDLPDEHSDGPEDASELSVARSVVRLLLAGIRDAERQVAERDDMIRQLTAALNEVYDMPLQRKINPEIVSGLVALGDKYPWLDPRITAQLARAGAGQ
jgi:hypothetical protein